MKLSQYCRDKWVSFIIFGGVFLAGGGLLLLIEIPAAVVCVVQGFYCAGFFLILLQDFMARKDFYNTLLEMSDEPEELACISEFLTEPSFLEGKLLYDILRQDEKNMNDRVAEYQRELQEYKEYVETWAHEVKTPIAVSRLIMENHRDEVTRNLEDEMDRLERFVEQMLYYTKSSSLQDDYIIRVISLKDLVMGAVKNNAKLMIAGGVLPRFDDLEGAVLTDSKWMDFILGQIITNAVKYRSDQRKPEIVFSAIRVGKSVRLSVTDNGIGIPAEDTDRVFRKGFTGKNGRKYPKSTGMGLYLCHTLCQKLGIDMALSSREGEGTVITFTLTAVAEGGFPT